jgi:hypothetical protein
LRQADELKTTLHFAGLTFLVPRYRPHVPKT